MEPSRPPGPILDEDQYRSAVLRLPSAESEQARAHQLNDEARQLGLKVPEIEASTSVAASIASGMVDLSSPVLSSGSSTDRISTYGGSVTPSYEPALPSPLDQAISSLSELTVASDRVKLGSTRSLASLSTRPTSYCSSEGITNNISSSYSNPSDGVAGRAAHRNSLLSVASADSKERRRSSLKSAIERIHFRKKRTPATAELPQTSRITVSKDGKGDVDRVYLESKPEANRPADHEESRRRISAEESESALKLEIPVFDQAALQRSVDDPELSEMHEQHRMERNRHLAFQDAALRVLRHRHQAVVSARQSDHQRQEDEKREKNQAAAVRLEERQLAIEVDQQREFERAKLNSRTRIKHMEGYFRNSSPPASPASTAQASSESIPGSDTTPPARRVTRQQKEQLEQQYHEHESMDQLHDARIKVLRERQELKLQEAIARMDQELESMCDQHVREISSLQSEHGREDMSLAQALDAKKSALQHRWHLEEAILRQQLENRHGQPYGPLPPLTFTAESETNPSASSIPDSPLGAGNDASSIPTKRDGAV